MRRVPMLAMVGACGPVPLSEVPIEGGTPELRARLRAELDAFEAAIGPDRIHLRYVRVVDLVANDDRVAGGYGQHRILLDQDNPSITVALRHELCHAINRAEDLVAEPHPLWDEIAAGLFTEYAGIIPLYPTAKRQRSEALAQFCELGPLAASALLDPCPGEAPIAEEIGAWLTEHVYREHDPLPPLQLDPSRAVTLDAWAPVPPTVAATAEPGRIAVGVDAEEGTAQLVAELGTGRLTAAALEPAPEVHDGPPARGVVRFQAVGWPDGPAAVSGVVSLVHLREGGERTFVYDPDEAGWRWVDEGCAPPEGAHLFTADGRVWRSWTDGPVLRWTALLPE